MCYIRQMQNILISTIRFGAVLVLALSIFVGEAFAAPALSPTSVTSLSNTSATLSAKMTNTTSRNTAVWFEWGDTPNPTTVIGMRDIAGEGYFQGYLSRLSPGTTYYFRAGALEGGVTVYSAVVAFTTRGGVTAAPNTNTVQLNTVSTEGSSLVTNTTAAVNTTSVVATPVSKTVVQEQAATKTASVQKTSNTKTDNPCGDNEKGAVVKNTAGSAAVGNTVAVLPGTLIGWISLLIGLLIVFLIMAMVLDSIEERRKAREAAKKKKLEHEAEIE